jgi:hypothetical protein
VNVIVVFTARGLVRLLVRLVIDNGLPLEEEEPPVEELPAVVTTYCTCPSAWLASAVTPAFRPHTATKYVPAVVGCHVNDVPVLHS